MTSVCVASFMKGMNPAKCQMNTHIMLQSQYIAVDRECWTETQDTWIQSLFINGKSLGSGYPLKIFHVLRTLL